MELNSFRLEYKLVLALTHVVKMTSKKTLLMFLIIILTFIIFIFKHQTTSFWVSQSNPKKSEENCQNAKEIYYGGDKKRYFNQTSIRTDSLPYVTGDTFRLFSDYVYDQLEITIPKNFDLIQDAIIFVKTDFLNDFFERYFKFIKTRIILITQNSDYPITAKFQKYLKEPRLKAWFAQNPELVHEKLVPIPIGFINAHFFGEYNKILNEVRKGSLKPWSERKHSLYINFDKNTNLAAREQFLNFSTKFKNTFKPERVDARTFFSHLNESKFVLCPRGNGLDTIRFYETILMGAIPIVESSTLDPIYEGSTVLVLKSLSDLTQEMLDSPHLYVKNMNFPKNIILMETWLKKIYAFRESQ
jgi:hypothetical protein